MTRKRVLVFQANDIVDNNVFELLGEEVYYQWVRLPLQNTMQ